jgi:hypothetical protein
MQFLKQPVLSAIAGVQKSHDATIKYLTTSKIIKLLFKWVNYVKLINQYAICIVLPYFSHNNYIAACFGHFVCPSLGSSC